jgi:hypothetical protein
MPWSKVDDRFHSHPKVVAAWKIDPAALGLYLRALSYTAEHLTDGNIGQAFVDELFPVRSRRKRAVDALVTTGLWDRNGTGYVIHDYLDFNDSRAKFLERRHRDSNRKRAGR